MSAIRQTTIRKEFKNIRRSFITIARAFDRIAPALSEPPAPVPAAPGTKSGRKKPRLSAAHKKALKLQGRYMGTMRGLAKSAQAKVKAERKNKGIRAAIALASKLASR